MNTIVGNEAVKKRLQKLIADNRVPHLMLFSGPEGIGKSLFAKNFAAMWLSALAKRPIAQNHPDISVISPEGKSGMHSIASIRRFQDEVHVSPFDAPGKVLIIDDAERMLPTSANTLLKTLEEPAANCLIILVSSCKDRILHTILSRCQEVRFTPCTSEEVFCFLQQHHQASREDLQHIAASSQGSIGKALRLCEKNLDDMQVLLFDFLHTSGWHHFHRISELSSQLQKLLENKRKEKEDALWQHTKEVFKDYSSQQKHLVEQEIEGALSVSWMQDVRSLFHSVVAYFRDLQALQCGPNHPELYFRDKKQELVLAFNQGQMVSLEVIEPLLAKAMQSLERSTPLQHVLESFMLALH